jgi:hypothetical protein
MGRSLDCALRASLEMTAYIEDFVDSVSTYSFEYMGSYKKYIIMVVSSESAKTDWCMMRPYNRNDVQHHPTHKPMQ